MSFRPGPGPTGTRNVPPKGYVAGLGRGAAGFTTRSDIGPISSSTTPALDTSLLDGSGGSRASEVRAAKLQMKSLQQQQQQQHQQQQNHSAPLMAPAGPFGFAPQGYVAGSGRGASFKREDDNEGDAGPMNFDSFGGYNENLFGSTPYDDDDEEADIIYNAIDERMNTSKKRKIQEGTEDTDNPTMAKIGDQFRDLKDKLAQVTEEEWAAIPAVADYRFVISYATSLHGF